MFSEFSFISVTSRNISHNGRGIGFSAIYTNVNGNERGFASLYPILPQENLLDKTLDEEISNYKQKTHKNFKALDNIHKSNLRRNQSQFLDKKNI